VWTLFTDTSETFIENANVGPPVWVYVIREMDKDRSINSIAKDLPHTYKTVHRLSGVIREAIYERQEEWFGPLTGEVEASVRVFERRTAGARAVVRRA